MKNHLFIIHGIVNSVVNGKSEAVDIQFYDLEQAFDALWLTECMNDAYDSIPTYKRDDRLVLLYSSSRSNDVAVRTACGLTDRFNIPNIVQQGVLGDQYCVQIV